MKDITVYQNLSHIEPMVSPSVIKPLCVPLSIDDSFTQELSNRRAQSVYSLWKRLGLVYLQEEDAAPAPAKSDIIVNNFSSQIIFQLFSQNNTHRLIESNQPGLVLFEKIFRQVSQTEKLTSKKISSQLSKLSADKAVYSHELGGLVSLLMGERESDSAVSEQALNTALVQVLRRVTEEKQLNERRIAVLECAAKAYERLGGEKNRVSQEISQLLAAGSQSGDSRLSEACAAIALRMIQNYSQEGGQSGVSRAAAEKAAEIALSRTTAQEAEKAVQEAVVRFYETYTSGSVNSVSNVKGALAAERTGASETVAPVGRLIPAEKVSAFGGTMTAQKSTADRVFRKNEADDNDGIIRIDSVTKEIFRASALGTTDVIGYDGQDGAAGSDGKSGANARGVILQPTADDPAVFQAAVFLLDQAAEERGISAGQNRITELFGRLSVSSIRRIISETAHRYTREIFRIASQETITSSDRAANVWDTARTAHEIAEQHRQDSPAEAEIVQRVIEQAVHTTKLILGGRQDALIFAGEKQGERRSMSAGLSARISAYSGKTDGMSAALGKRVSRYVADKFRYEQKISSDDAAAGGITDFALLAKSGSDFASLGEITQALSGRNALSAEHSFAERYLLDDSAGVIRAKAVAAPNNSGEFPRGGETYFTENGANIENSQIIRNVQNAQNVADITNVTNASQPAPVGEVKPLSAAERGGETYFTENSANIENSQIIRNVQNAQNVADITNVTNASQPAPVGEVKPLSTAERGGETYYSEHGANIENSQSIRNVQNVHNGANTTNVTNAAQSVPVGEVKPLSEERGGETYFTEHTANIENSQSIRNVQNVHNGANTTNVTNAAQSVPVGEVKPLSEERGGETYFTGQGANIENSQIIRNVQNIQNVADITNVTNSSQPAPVGEVKSLSAAERGGETYFTENGANIENSQSIRNVQNAQNAANITKVTNAAQGVPVGEVKPLSTAERGGETYYSEHGANIENSQIIRNVQNVQNVADITNVTNSSQPAPVGKVKPLGATERGGDVYYIENGDTASVIRPQVLPLSGYKMNAAGGVYRAARAETADKHAAFIPDNVGKRGRFVPPEPSAGIYIVNGAYSSAVSSDSTQRDNLSAELSLHEYDKSLFPERKTQEREIISRSLRNRLDSSTIAALDRLIKQAHTTKESNVSENLAAYAVSQVEKPPHISEQLSWQEQNNAVPEGGGTLISSQGIVHRMSSTLMRLIHRHLKAAAMTKTDISVSAASLNSSSHISRFIKSLEQSEQNTAEGIARNIRISFRTIEDSENMVMLIPPAEMDRYEAESGYVRNLPPIEYKQKAEPEQRESASAKPKTINTTSTEQTVKKAISGGFDSMTREQINRLADKVYAQIEARILRERRRIGR